MISSTRTGKPRWQSSVLAVWNKWCYVESIQLEAVIMKMIEPINYEASLLDYNFIKQKLDECIILTNRHLHDHIKQFMN